jgi:cysteine-rich repeat protein
MNMLSERKEENMRRKFLVVLLVIVTSFSISMSVRAATPEQIEAAINNGLAWLATQQQADGSWVFAGSYTDVASTGLILVKLCDRADELDLDPFDNNPSSPTYFLYADNVIKGFDYLLGTANFDAVGISSYSYVYSTGISMMAVAASNVPDRLVGAGPLAGQTYNQVLKGMMDWMVDAQNDSDCGIGGWGYTANQQSWADNSNSGYATIGIGFAGTQAYDFMIPVPPSVFNGLDTFIANVQITSGSYAGGSLYNPCWGTSSMWVNILKTGNLLYEMATAGISESDPRVLSAVGFIENYWNAVAGPYDGGGWIGDYQAMFLMKKGFAGYDPIDDPAPAFKIITVGGNPVDWFDEVSTYIVNNQNPTGYWIATAGETADPIIDTAWALLTLEPTVPVPVPRENCFNGVDDDGDGLIDNDDPNCWVCGDGNLDPGEQCDDGNRISGDGCDENCILENKPPDCSDAYSFPGCLWPPNHKYPMMPVNIIGVTDPDGDAVTITINSITSDEPTATIKGAGGPMFAPDASGVGTSSAMIRAERSGLKDGRVYIINFTADDGKGGLCAGSVAVYVPHDMRSPQCRAIDSGQKYDATKIN